MISYSLGWIHQHFEKLERTLFPLIVPRIHSTAVERLQLPETNCLQKSEPLLARERKESHIWELQNIKAHNTPVFSVVFELSALKKEKEIKNKKKEPCSLCVHSRRVYALGKTLCFTTPLLTSPQYKESFDTAVRSSFTVCLREYNVLKRCNQRGFHYSGITDSHFVEISTEGAFGA